MSNPIWALPEPPGTPPPPRQGAARPALQPVLAFGSLAGLDAGGSRAEERDQNRVWSQAAAGFRFDPDSWGRFHPRVSLVLGAEDDYRRTGPGRSQQLSGWVPGFLAVGAGLWGPVPPRDSAWWGDASRRNSVKVAGALAQGPDRNPDALALYLQAAAGAQRADPEGLFLAGNLPAVRAGAVFGWRGTAIQVGGFGAGLADVGAWDWASAFRDHIVGGTLEFRRGSHELALIGSFERYPGESELPALRLPLPGAPVVTSGRVGVRDEDIRTGGLRLSSDTWLRATFAVYNQRGRTVAVTPDGGRSPQTTRTVAAGAVFASLGYSFGAATGVAQIDPADPAAETDSGDCTLPMESVLCGIVPLRTSPYLELAALGTTADRDDADRFSRGFAGAAARPSVMGGVFSVLLSGPGPGGERAPFARGRARSHLVDTRAVDPDRSELRTESRPDRENSGLRMGSLRFSTGQSRRFTRLQLDLFGNHAQYLTGEGYELIAVIQTAATERRRLRLLFAATTARYRSFYRQSNVWTGIEEPAQTEYYRRFFLMAAWSF